MTHEQPDRGRKRLLRRALRLEWLTVGWNAVEGIIAVAAAMAAGSVALLGFGIDSFVETVSGAVILWRIAAERRSRDPERIDRVEGIARRGVALSLWLLALYVAADATVALVSGERPSASAVGVALLVLSIAVMKWLANAKRAVALALHSHAMEADAAQTDFCWKLSVVALIGLVANAVLGWWWADPLAALGLASLIAVEAGRTWRIGLACC
ncbi:MAG: cation transporter [bacterium]|nr:cation transporter [bacterium]